MLESRNTSKEKALLAALKLPRQAEETITRSLYELKRLAETAGDEVVDMVIESRDGIHPRTFVGPGQAAALGKLATDLKAAAIIFDNNLSPSQQRNLEDETGLRIIDRTSVILEIFARHARSKEGSIQVELAQSEYRLPRLSGKGIEMSRMAGGIGTRRGPGEQKLEIDRRRVKSRIKQLKKELDKLTQVRVTQSKKRKKGGVFEVCLVGYTNAGKSTLLNRMTGANVIAEDLLFATLDSTTRRLPAVRNPEIVISDTVGFIKNLPHELVAAFRSTLDGVREADLLLHIINTASPAWRQELTAVEAVLNEIGAGHTARLNVFNQMDRVEKEEIIRLKREFPDALLISALAGLGMDDLVAAITDAALSGKVRVSLLIPEDKRGLLEQLYACCEIVSEQSSGHGLAIIADLPRSKVMNFSGYVRAKTSSVDTAEDGDDPAEH